MTSTSSSTTTDPQGWVTNPPSTLVKIHDVTSRPTLNGCLAVVLQYAADRQRYVVHTAVTQEAVSLKAENLQKASWMEQIKGQYQLLRYNPTIQRQLQTLYHKIETRAPGGIKPEYLGVAALVVLLVAMYMIGFTRVMMILTALLLLLTIIGEDLFLLSGGGNNNNAATTTMNTIVRNAPHRFRTLIRQQIPIVGPRIADSAAMSAAVAGLLVLLFVRSMMPPAGAWGSSSSSSSSSSGMPMPVPPSSSSSSSSSGTITVSESLIRDKYYKLGFEDATANLPFGASLLKTTIDDEQDDSSTTTYYPDFDFVDTTTRKPKSSTLFSFGNIMSAAYLIMTLNQLGKDPVTGRFSIATARQNMTTLSPYQMGMMGLSVYKLVSALFL